MLSMGGGILLGSSKAKVAAPPVFEQPYLSGAGFGLATVGTMRCRSGWRSCKPALCLSPPPALDILVAFRLYRKGAGG